MRASEDQSADLKQQVRRQALARRRRQPDKDRLSRVICGRFTGLDQYTHARTVMCYVHFRSEVRTGQFLSAALAAGKRIVVPYCLPDELGLFRLTDPGQLEPGVLGIPEPKRGLRRLRRHRVDVGELDLVMVPGVAFDRQGSRLGHGRGYYDKLLAKTQPNTPLVGVAFHCQLFDHLPTQPHDITMGLVLTEQATYARAS